MKNIIKIIILGFVIFFSTGCVSEYESIEIREVLEKRGYIASDWKHVRNYYEDAGSLFPNTVNYSIYEVNGQFNMVYIYQEVSNLYEVVIYYDITQIKEHNPLTGSGTGNVIKDDYIIMYEYSEMNEHTVLEFERKKFLFFEYFKVTEKQN